MQVAADGGSVMAGGLDVEDQSVAQSGERSGVEIAGPGEVHEHLDAAADQSALHVDVPVAIETGPGAGGVERGLADLRVVDEVHESLPIPARRALDDLALRGQLHDVEPARETVRVAVGGVHEVRAMERGPAGEQRERGEEGGDVREADDPRRFAAGDDVPVQLVDEVDGGLAAPRGDDSADCRVHEEALQLFGALPGRGADMT